MKNLRSERILGIDVIRFFSFIAIHIYHVIQTGWGDYTFNLSERSEFFQWCEYYARPITFSGFSIAFLTSFLKGRKRKEIKYHLYLYLFMGAGWLAFCAMYTLRFKFKLMWDIYPLLILGFISSQIFRMLGDRYLNTLGLLGFALLWIPFWKITWLNELPLLLKPVIIGVCEIHNADWPVLPWIGLIWLGFALGNFYGNKWIRIRKYEGIFWSFVLLLSLIHLGGYYNVPLNSDYTCFVFRQSPFVFWSNFIWVMFLMRISIDPRVHRFLESLTILKWLNQLCFSQNFWLFYFLHYLYCYLFFKGKRVFYIEYPRMAEFAFILIPIITELSCRCLLKLGLIANKSAINKIQAENSNL